MHHTSQQSNSECVTEVASTRAVQAGLAVAGILFVLYPAIRPFSSEKGLDGARAFASNAWLVAHSLAIVGFLLVGFGLLALTARLHRTSSGPLATRALLAGAAGIGLTLPFYGAEVFGLHAIGKEALARNDASLVSMSDTVRFGVGIGFITVGLVLLAVSTVMFARAVWRSGTMPQWSGVPLAAAFVLYLPQFSAGQAIRVAHGCLVLAGCLALAWGLRAAAPADDTVEVGSPDTGRSSDREEAAVR
jgi:hypothetical protein